MKYKYHNNAKGIVLIIILMLVAAITIVALGFIVRGDTELLCGQNMEMAARLSYLAESGLAHARGLIMYPQDINIDGWSATGQQLVSGTDYYDVNVTKISDCNWQITSSAYRQVSGGRTAQNSLTALMRLNPAIAFWSGASVLLTQAANITGDVYCNGVLTNLGTINGDCFADSLTGNPVTGAVKAKTDLQLSRPTISSSILTSNFTTQTISDSNLNNTTLSGATQVYYRNGNLEIKKGVIINGCLVVDGNLTVSNIGNIINAQKNVPALYVSGNLIIKENAAMDCNGLVFVDGRIEAPICNRTLNVTGSLWTDEGIRHIVPDYSGNGYDGIVNGDCAWVAGKIGGAINFDGNGDFIDIGNASQLNLTNNITVSAWIKVTAFDKPSQAIVTKGNDSWQLRRYASTNNIEFCISDSDKIHSNVNVNDGQWHYIAGTFDGETINLYVDSILPVTAGASDNINSNSSPVYIGENSGAPGKYFNGAIDDVRVYKEALNLIDITSIIAGGSPKADKLVGWWTMDWSNSSTTVKASPTKAAIYHWPGGVKDRWSPAAGAFYKSITRNP